MDLERIKQNLRLRSGRSKKPSKKPRTQTPGAANQNTRTDRSQPPTNDQPNEHVPTPSAVDTSTVRQSSQPPTEGRAQSKTTSPQRQDSQAYPSPPSTEHRTASSHLANSDGIEVQEQQNEEEVTDSPARTERTETENEPSQALSKTMTDTSRTSETEDYDLRPPAPKPKPPSMESMSELLFSPGHLNTLIYQPILLAKFTAFLQQYRPQDHPLLLRYLETSKAIKAIEYANAVAESAPPLPQVTEGNETETSNIAATLDTSFTEACSSAFDTLLNTTLPLYITYTLVRTISECLIDEITGRATSLMREMVGGLSEVFCLTDPNQKDNPIIYASEEFYRLTGYGADDVISHNCRFLQGPKTNPQSPKRLRQSLERGEETYETLLNYRRDGKPFINVLMIAPLHDNGGKVKYNIGAQIDASRLIESGMIMDSFQKYLAKIEADKKREAKESAKNGDSESVKKRNVLKKLRELSELFDLDESTVVQSHSRSSSLGRDEEVRSIGSGNARRRLADSDASNDDYEQETDEQDWKLGQAGSSGKLPGIYEKYMLVRPAPSLRVVFVSPKLRKFGKVVQSPFLSHVAAPAGTLSGLAESFESGTPVSARINFMPQRTEHRYGTTIPPTERHEDGKHGRACWMSATPLLGGDEKVGVWIVVFVEKGQANVQRARAKKSQGTTVQNQNGEGANGSTSANRTTEQKGPGPPGTNQKQEGRGKSEGLPIKPKRLDDAIEFTAERQDGQRPVAAYQRLAATPVEEYHSADEDGESASPVVSAPRADMPPQTPKYEGVGEEEYVRPTSIHSPSPSPHRVRISPDSDQEHDAADNSASTKRLDSSPDMQQKDEVLDPNEISPSMPSDQESLPFKEDTSVGPATSARSASSENDHNFGTQSMETIRNSESSPLMSPRRSPSSDSQQPQSQPTPSSTKSHKTNAARSSGMLPAGLGYMDYLRYTGSGHQGSGEAKRGRRKLRHESDSDPWSETECAKSPNSVD